MGNVRVTSGTFYQNYSVTVQNLHGQLNDTMEQVSSGRKYKDAAENPLAYYKGKTIDNEYNNIKAQDSVINDVINRMYQQEEGAKGIQTEMNTVQTNMMRAVNDSSNGEVTTIETINQDYQQRLQSMVSSDMNAQYENYYVFGGNDTSTLPFTLDMDLDNGSITGDASKTPDSSKNSITLTYSHKFPGSDDITKMNVKYTLTDKGELKTEYSGSVTHVDDKGKKTETALTSTETLEKMYTAMTEQGRMSLGYGNIVQRDTLPDTVSNGLNMISGLDSEGLKSLMEKNEKTPQNVYDQIDKGLKNSPIGLLSKTIMATQTYTDKMNTDALKDGEAGKTTGAADAYKETYHKAVGEVLDEWDDSGQRVSNTYRQMGVRQAALKTVQENLQQKEDTLTEEYTSILGIDTYDAIVQMYQRQYAYNAAMKVGSNIMQSNLFDYVR